MSDLLFIFSHLSTPPSLLPLSRCPSLPFSLSPPRVCRRLAPRWRASFPGRGKHGGAGSGRAHRRARPAWRACVACAMVREEGGGRAHVAWRSVRAAGAAARALSSNPLPRELPRRRRWPARGRSPDPACAAGRSSLLPHRVGAPLLPHTIGAPSSLALPRRRPSSLSCSGKSDEQGSTELSSTQRPEQSLLPRRIRAGPWPRRRAAARDNGRRADEAGAVGMAHGHMSPAPRPHVAGGRDCRAVV